MPLLFPLTWVDDSTGQRRLPVPSHAHPDDFDIAILRVPLTIFDALPTGWPAHEMEPRSHYRPIYSAHPQWAVGREHPDVEDVAVVSPAAGISSEPPHFAPARPIRSRRLAADPFVEPTPEEQAQPWDDETAPPPSAMQSRQHGPPGRDLLDELPVPFPLWDARAGIYGDEVIIPHGLPLRGGRDAVLVSLVLSVLPDPSQTPPLWQDDPRATSAGRTSRATTDERFGALVLEYPDWTGTLAEDARSPRPHALVSREEGSEHPLVLSYEIATWDVVLNDHPHRTLPIPTAPTAHIDAGAIAYATAAQEDEARRQFVPGSGIGVFSPRSEPRSRLEAGDLTLATAQIFDAALWPVVEVAAVGGSLLGSGRALAAQGHGPHQLLVGAAGAPDFAWQTYAAGGIAIGGPWYVVAHDVWCAGAEAGDVLDYP